MPDENESGKHDVIGLKGLPATVVKLGMAGMVVLMLSWKIMVNDPDERKAAREHGDRAVERIGTAIDRQTQTIVEVQTKTHRNQELLLEAAKSKRSSPW